MPGLILQMSLSIRLKLGQRLFLLNRLAQYFRAKSIFTALIAMRQVLVTLI